MTKKSKEKTSESNDEQAVEELTPEQLAEQNELITFVANNILNSITMNQTVTLLQQVSLRDATTIVKTADESKLQEIKDALEASKKPAEQPAAEQSDAEIVEPVDAEEQSESDEAEEDN